MLERQSSTEAVQDSILPGPHFSHTGTVLPLDDKIPLQQLIYSLIVASSESTGQIVLSITGYMF